MLRRSTSATIGPLSAPLQGKPAALSSSSVGVFQSGVNASRLSLRPRSRFCPIMLKGILAVLPEPPRSPHRRFSLLRQTRHAEHSITAQFRQRVVEQRRHGVPGLPDGTTTPSGNLLVGRQGARTAATGPTNLFRSGVRRGPHVPTRDPR